MIFSDFHDGTGDRIDSSDTSVYIAYCQMILESGLVESSGADELVPLASLCLGGFGRIGIVVPGPALQSFTQGRRAGPPYRARDTPG